DEAVDSMSRTSPRPAIGRRESIGPGPGGGWFRLRLRTRSSPYEVTYRAAVVTFPNTRSRPTVASCEYPVRKCGSRVLIAGGGVKPRPVGNGESSGSGCAPGKKSCSEKNG